MSDLNNITAPWEYTGGRPSVFLAGGISGCPDWQREAVALFTTYAQMDHGMTEPLVTLNPRRPSFTLDNPMAASEQVAWEHNHLMRADVVLFWFPASGDIPQPIALYELGRYAALDKPIVVGCDPGYARRVDVQLQMRHARTDLRVCDSLAATTARAFRLARALMPR